MRIKRVVRLRNLYIILVLLIVALATVSFDLRSEEKKKFGVYLSPTGVVYSGIDGSTNPEEIYFEIRYRDVTSGGSYVIITSTTPGQANYIPGQTGTGGTFVYDFHPYFNYVEGHTYEAQASASNVAGSSPWIPSPAFSFTMPPADPSNMVATVGANGVDILFMDNSNFEVGFKVERDVDNLFTNPVDVCLNLQTNSNVGVGIVTCTDTDTLSPGSYYYRVQSLGIQYNSDYAESGEVVISGAPTPPSPPTDFAGVGISVATANSVELTWTDSNNANEYLVQRDDGTGVFVPVDSCGIAGVVPAGDEGCTDTDSILQQGQMYTYQIEGFGELSGLYSVPVTTSVSIPVFVGDPVITDVSSSTGAGTGGVLDPAIVDMTQGSFLTITGSGFSVDANVFIGGIEFIPVSVSLTQIVVNLIDDVTGSLIALCPLNVNAQGSGCNAGIQALTVENVPASPGSVGSEESYIKLEAPAPVIISYELNSNPVVLNSLTFAFDEAVDIAIIGDGHIREESATGYLGTYLQFGLQGNQFITRSQSQGLDYDLQTGNLLNTFDANTMVPGTYDLKTSNPNQVISVGNTNGISQVNDPTSNVVQMVVTQSSSCNLPSIPIVTGITASSSGTNVIDNRGAEGFTITGIGFSASSELFLSSNSLTGLVYDPVTGNLNVEDYDVDGMPYGVYGVRVRTGNCVSLEGDGVTLTVNEETPQITLEYSAISEGGNSDILGTAGNGFYGSNSWNTESEVGLVDSAGNGFLPLVQGSLGLYSYISSIRMNFNVLNYPLGTYYTAVRNPSGVMSNVDTFDVVVSACGNGYPDVSEECGEPGLTCSAGTCNANTCLCEGSSVDPPGPGPGPGGSGGSGGGGGSSGSGSFSVAAQCNNNRDDDGDGDCDWDGATVSAECSGDPDPGCAGAADNDEFNTISLGGIKECNDGLDNDGDGFIDFPNDPECDTVIDNTEASEGTTVGGIGGDDLSVDYVKVIKGTIIGILIAGIIVVALLIVRTLRRRSTFIELAKKSPVVSPNRGLVTYKSK